MEFLSGNVGAQEANLNAIKNELAAAKNMTNENRIFLTFKRGDRFTIPHVANNNNFVGNGDHHHVRIEVSQLN